MQKVINQFAQLGVDPRVSFFGNVHAGQDVTLSDLRALFNGVRFVHCLAMQKHRPWLAYGLLICRSPECRIRMRVNRCKGKLL